MTTVAAFCGAPWFCRGTSPPGGGTSPQGDGTSSQVNFSRRAVCRLGLALFTSTTIFARADGVSGVDQTSRERSDIVKKLFAEGMETGMLEYERSIASVKHQLFSKISPSDQVVDVGIGTGPNLRFLPRGVQVVGVDPNEYMWPYAMAKASSNGIDLRLVEGVCEKLPLEDTCYDFVIVTLTLCSVQNPSQAVSEILRVLKPGGTLIFIEHVLADPSRPVFRAAQRLLNPLQVAFADGCHLNRDTARILQTAKEPGFSEIKYDEFDVGGVLNPIRPHIVGYARKASP